MTMMFLTTIDVIGRNLFNAPLPGGYEVTAFLLMTLFFLSLPIVTIRNGHITVNLIDGILGNQGLRNLLLFYNTIAAIMMSALTWFLVRLALDINRYGDLSLYLQIPKAPFIFLAAASVGITAAIFIFRIVLFFIPGLSAPQNN